MEKPSYEEVVAALCSLAIQHHLCDRRKVDGFGRVVKEGASFQTFGVSAGEEAEVILFSLGFIDADGFVIGQLPMSPEEVAERLAV